jgi:hypothetical protein
MGNGLKPYVLPISEDEFLFNEKNGKYKVRLAKRLTNPIRFLEDELNETCSADAWKLDDPNYVVLMTRDGEGKKDLCLFNLRSDTNFIVLDWRKWLRVAEIDAERIDEESSHPHSISSLKGDCFLVSKSNQESYIMQIRRNNESPVFNNMYNIKNPLPGCPLPGINNLTTVIIRIGFGFDAQESFGLFCLVSARVSRRVGYMCEEVNYIKHDLVAIKTRGGVELVKYRSMKCFKRASIRGYLYHFCLLRDGRSMIVEDMCEHCLFDLMRGYLSLNT